MGVLANRQTQLKKTYIYSVVLMFVAESHEKDIQISRRLLYSYWTQSNGMDIL